jgi:hypothetical protein
MLQVCDKVKEQLYGTEATFYTRTEHTTLLIFRRYDFFKSEKEKS